MDGKGQLTSAKIVLKELNLENIALIGHVKDDKHKTKGIISKEEKNILENDYTYYDKILRLVNI